jgi:hypothetical protein
LWCWLVHAGPSTNDACIEAMQQADNKQEQAQQTGNYAQSYYGPFAIGVENVTSTCTIKTIDATPNAFFHCAVFNSVAILPTSFHCC